MGMRIPAVLVLIFAMAMASTALAKKKAGPGIEGSIVEINALSITLSVGKSGDTHMQYKIMKQTVIKLDGAVVTTDTLRAGMVANVVASKDDPDTALSILAHDPPKR